MKTKGSHEVVEKWLKAWSLSRKLPLPVRYQSGFKVEVGEEKQKMRYVFSEVNNDFLELSNQIDDSWIYLKVCASPDEVTKVVSEKWILQPPGYMMCCFGPMKNAVTDLCKGYRIESEEYNSTTVIKIITESGEQASIGRIVLVDDLAVYDRIVTEENHRKKGLATFLMRELEKIALSKDISNNFLVATEQGRTLYQSIGWELYSNYTSIVIPGI
ncbi:GNAT family N-acetyltransferase [Chryseobacterium shigense]|uniref:Acetyltransferase (GNAT) domain-containing protein n=1 Tax=Chryseobacterium shigense TaxID=297244 RepID=A0A1N7HWP0_9FLAO|nr:GNAT family N-acetyltransferase [Chryseobacterium shigense]PQA92002.1 GNAT family N-acetyltransferase [Chryseobacterium shigense]SIS29264.1 Acetyltransferase (GNAT) domain-containing protein [Chryseobacterium shigense]